MFFAGALCFVKSMHANPCKYENAKVIIFGGEQGEQGNKLQEHQCLQALQPALPVPLLFPCRKLGEQILLSIPQNICLDTIDTGRAYAGQTLFLRTFAIIAHDQKSTIT